MYPPRPEPRKAWHGLSRNQGVTREHDEQYQMSTGTCELRLEIEEMVSTIAIITKQHLINIVCPLTYLTWIIKWRNPNWCDDGRIQIRQVARRTVFGMIRNYVSINSLQLQHTWRLDHLNPQDNVTERSVQNTIKLPLEIHKVTNIKLSHLRFIIVTSCVCIL